MKTFEHGTVWYDEKDLLIRRHLVEHIAFIFEKHFTAVNRAIRFVQIETPVLVSGTSHAGHIKAGFPLWNNEGLILRPETTAGTIQALYEIYPQKSCLKKALPLCLWQYGKSFRMEKTGEVGIGKKRLYEFYQLEFQFFTPTDTQMDYLEYALQLLIDLFNGKREVSERLPHYSLRTVDLIIDDVGCASLSERTDFAEGKLFEVSIGLDRLMLCLPKERE